MAEAARASAARRACISSSTRGCIASVCGRPRMPGLRSAHPRRRARVEGLWTHFADSELDDAGTLVQLARFRAAADALAAAGITIGVLHAANSGATIRFPQTHLDLVRPGAAVYGIDPGGGLADPFGLRPALSWRSAVTMVKRLPTGERLSYGGRYALERDATIATAGRVRRRVPEAAWGKGEVLIGGVAIRSSARSPWTRSSWTAETPRCPGRRGGADRHPGRRTRHGRGARRACRHDPAPDRDRDRRTRSARVSDGGRTSTMSRKRAALVTAGIAAGAVAGGVIGRTVLNARRRGAPQADERLSELPPEDLGPVRSFDGTELAVRAAGDPSNPTIVFVHGFSLDMTTWHYQWTACRTGTGASCSTSVRTGGARGRPAATYHRSGVRPRPRGGPGGGRGQAGAAGRTQHGRDVDAGDGRDATRAVGGPGRGRGVRGLGRERSRRGRSARSPSSSGLDSVRGGRRPAREPAPAVRAVEPGRRRPVDRSRDTVRSDARPTWSVTSSGSPPARRPRYGPTAWRGCWRWISVTRSSTSPSRRWLWWASRIG